MGCAEEERGRRPRHFVNQYLFSRISFKLAESHQLFKDMYDASFVEANLQADPEKKIKNELGRMY